MYIEPCCMSRQLPALLKKQSYSFFQSNGDWTTSELIKAVTYLVKDPVALLAMQETDVFLLRELNRFLQKKWWKSLVLVTGESQQDLVNSFFADRGNVLYVHSNQVIDGQLALTNFQTHLYIQGPMLTQNDFTLCNYAAYLGKDHAAFRSMVESLIPKARIHRKENCSDEIKQLLDFKMEV